MATTAEVERAQQLAQQAASNLTVGNFANAARALREASHLAPEDPTVKTTWLQLQEVERKTPLLSICKTWVRKGQEEDGEKALAVIKESQLTREVAEQAMIILLEFQTEDDMADQVTGELLRHRGAREALASEFRNSPHSTFRQLFARGDDSMDGLVSLVLDTTIWPSEDACIQAQRDLFMLSLAQMMEAGNDHPERAMKAIARLLAVQATHLHGIIDYDCFAVILSSLDIRLPMSLRSQATVATARLLELAPDTAQRLITDFVKSKVQKPTTEGLIVAFSAAAAIFPITPAVAATLFLSDGFLSGFVNLVQLRRSQRLEQAALELLSAACIDKTCREGISKHCRGWLKGIVHTATDSKRSSLAGLILVKLGEEDPTGQDPKVTVAESSGQDELIARFKEMVVSSDGPSKQDSIEGLAYASLKPRVKEDLAHDPAFIGRLIGTMSDPSVGKPIMFGGLTIFVNLTAYLPVQSEEDKKMAQLKAYANQSKPTEANPLDDNNHVTARCKRVLQAGIVPLLVNCSKRASPSVLSQMLQILLSLSKEQKHRGLMAQQGAVKLIIQIWDAIHKEAHPHASSYGPLSNRTAAHALARILISVNPTLAFGSGGPPATSAIRPLLFLLEDDPSTEKRDLLPVFEALLALTNLASMEDAVPRDTIIRLAFNKLEDLCLSSNALIQRATVELICNLMASPHGVAKFADGSKQASNRLHILLALADVDDMATRRAAGGALAMLTEWDAAVEAVLKRERGVVIIIGLCKDENEELQHRGIVCIKNIVSAPKDIGVKGREAVKKAGGVEVLKSLLTKTRNQVVLEVGVEALKPLVEG